MQDNDFSTDLLVSNFIHNINGKILLYSIEPVRKVIAKQRNKKRNF